MSDLNNKQILINRIIDSIPIESLLQRLQLSDMEILENYCNKALSELSFNDLLELIEIE